MSNQAFVSDTVTGQDSTARLRLINFPAYGSNMLPAHRAALATLVANEVAGKVVEDVFINGYAYNDHAVGMQRAEVVANEFVRLAPWLASSVALNSSNSAPLRASKKRSENYWRGVDVLVYRPTPKPVPKPTPPREPPPPPGPRRYRDWEVYAEWGCSFSPAPMAMISLNAYHFRLKSNPGHGQWFGTIQFGAGQSVDLAKAFKLARLAKAMGVSRLRAVLGKVSVPQSLRKSVEEFLESSVGSVSDPEYSDAPAKVPFALSDLSGATAYGSSTGIGAGHRSVSSAYLTVTKKMPVYQLKLIHGQPEWRLVSHSTVRLLEDVDIGGWATGLPDMPSANASFVGGPLLGF